jgi:hypothetical protein
VAEVLADRFNEKWRKGKGKGKGKEEEGRKERGRGGWECLESYGSVWMGRRKELQKCHSDHQPSQLFACSDP